MSIAQKRKRFITATPDMKSAVRTESLNIIQIITVYGVNIILAVLTLPFSRVQYNDYHH